MSSKLGGQYRRHGEPFAAKTKGTCLICKKPINVGDTINTAYFTNTKIPCHYDCDKPKQELKIIL